MRRARIKAMATVPVRRKVVQDSQTTEGSSIPETNDDVKLPNIEPPAEKPIEMNSQSEQIQGDAIPTTPPVSAADDQSGKATDNSDTQIEERRSVEDRENSNERSVEASEVPLKTEIASPVKTIQNRSCFMRPTPRLDTGGRVRRNSVQGSGASASESEDDSRRSTDQLRSATTIVTTGTTTLTTGGPITAATTMAPSNRMRNDSVCSVQSNKEASGNSICQNTSLTKFKSSQKRRMLVSESARKLAEARREFLLKHENKMPDRSKLTMYDLIYYNPVTNPMKKSKEAGNATRKISISQPEEIQEEENEDDPSAMPVPQVKVGPDGQLIIDEQSLVIEQTNAKRSREVLAKEAIVDDDNTGSGFYKRRQKSKEWPKWETLKFYKALNTVGTDFLLMQSLFPNRTRQEIKLKFKKEEKINRKLVEKALMYHQEFDTEMLEKELATFEETEKEQINVQRKRQSEVKEKKRTKYGRKRICRIVASSIAEMDASEDEEDFPETPEIHPEDTNLESESATQLNSIHRKKRSKPNKRSLEESPSDLSLINDLESVASTLNSDSDSEIYQVRPTRSGRLPKIKKLQGPDLNNLDNASDDYSQIDEDHIELPESVEDLESPEQNETITEALNTLETAGNTVSDGNVPEAGYPDAIKTILPDINQVEPGSLVILSKESPEEPGKTVLQVYMVSSNINSSEKGDKPDITPVELSPNLLATVTTRLSDVEPISLKKD